ncbi:MAG: tRNA lysidine(34) synthetase TilS, partial [Clostridiales bacterium]|nr:tRNA lysidine(34) synthetase TilS [Clostridiales bacterium]
MITEILNYAKRCGMFPSSGTVLACVSGGADSMALLTALMELAPLCGFSVEAAHFDHRLRGAESDRDREFVTEYCKKLGVAFHVCSGDTRGYARENRLGIEAAARELRYAFFRKTAEKTGASRIATAHNSDDNAETVLLNLARGAGSRGLSGIPPVRGDIIRPLLCVSRKEIEAYLESRGVPFITDSTNISDKYARNRIRRHVSRVLQSVNASYLRHVLESGELLRRDDEFLTALADEFLAAYGGSVSVSALSALPEAVSARVVLSLAGGALSFSQVRRVLDMCGEKHGTKTVETSRGSFVREYDKLSFGCASPKRTFLPVEISPGGEVEIPELGLKIFCRLVDFGDFYEKCHNNSDAVHISFIYF